jgi:hypothetical protein
MTAESELVIQNRKDTTNSRAAAVPTAENDRANRALCNDRESIPKPREENSDRRFV